MATVRQTRLVSCILHDNAPAHTGILVRQFLAKRGVTVLKHPHIFLIWSQTSCYTIHEIKIRIKGDRFEDVKLIQADTM